MVTVGRILFAAIERQFPETRTYRLLPFVAAAAMGLIAILPGGDATLGLLAFGLAGLGCSALLPLTISFGQAELVAIGASVAGLLIAFYQMGYGLAAFGIGPLQELVGLSPVDHLRRGGGRRRGHGTPVVHRRPRAAARARLNRHRS